MGPTGAVMDLCLFHSNRLTLVHIRVFEQTKTIPTMSDAANFFSALMEDSIVVGTWVRG